MTILATDRAEPEAGQRELAGGKVDLFEPVADAVKREVAEELGIGIEPDKHDGLDWFALEAPPEPLTLAAKTAIGLIRQGQTRG
ncbi:NUDIX domain-containing protein [Methylobacterium sp. ARG-1]|uniref:NUDIX domain-containing protein n=1 Tax=Methylobacterium sp. ARG-1 TaxID=1692501 RepID=UPI0006833001|nr:NUDIX domain-containing protein [Methylobacterium sp. ARG-1]KNY22005.1 hypothetical protein AKJ13_14225 [Methylobacterium sp. ARG-1]